MSLRLRQHSVLPGFGLTLGITLLYLALIVLIPLSGVAIKTFELTWQDFVANLTSPRVIASFRITFVVAGLAALINAIFGLTTAWVLERYAFPGKRIIDAFVDLPFALPTAVAGIALTAIYAPNGLIGKHLDAIGIKAAYSPLGILIALTFIGLPFVVRTVQPVIADLDAEIEEAAASLGATRFHTFRRVLLPALWPALLTGVALSFARALGEYGSVVFISGNMPMKTEIVPLLIVTKLEQYDYAGATALALVMLGASFILLLVINVLQWWARQRHA
ncbi:MAG: sulfate ABC transporter permease subunit CysT [Candidatus Sumerlaeia bacterium]|nr:sulfate ABC transporter permease subunit CysT [Candidatus Sumerlaeia bacterium]